MNLQDDILDTSRLNLTGDFDTQVNDLLQEIRLTRIEVEQLQSLFVDLEHTLWKAWPGCDVHPFGSVITGLGIRTSDIDCYVALPDWARTTAPGQVVMHAKHILARQHFTYTEVFAIPGAKVPIVRFFHIPNAWHCDVNFKSPSGVLNSKLIAYLLQMDSRALPLAIIIKYWSKVHKFTGTNLLANYALTMLVIFYLQQKEILPSVHTLQSTVPPYIVDGWNCAFETRIQYVPSNDESLYNLLGGFFMYYDEFDFSEFMVSPYLGRPVSRKLFKTIHDVPNECSLLKHYLMIDGKPLTGNEKNMFIQDPFELYRNCAISVHQSLAHKIKEYIKFAATSFAQKSSEQFLTILLKRASVPVHVEPKKKKKNFKNKMKKQKAVLKRNIKSNALALFSEYKKFIKKEEK